MLNKTWQLFYKDHFKAGKAFGKVFFQMAADVLRDIFAVFRFVSEMPEFTIPLMNTNVQMPSEKQPKTFTPLFSTEPSAWLYVLARLKTSPASV